MSKQCKKLSFRLPSYCTPRNLWRKEINEVARAAQLEADVKYVPSDRLSVTVRLYMPDAELVPHDVDNRMKDVFDALQGRAGGPKAKRTLPGVIPNDNQIFRVEMEKSSPPKQSRGLGHVIIRKLST
jgi:Holliday junction resolvase RusA-like endonuclease